MNNIENNSYESNQSEKIQTNPESEVKKIDNLQEEENNKKEKLIKLNDEKNKLQKSLEEYKVILDGLDESDEGGEKELYTSIISVIEDKMKEISSQEEANTSSDERFEEFLDDEEDDFDSLIDGALNNIKSEQVTTKNLEDDTIDSLIEDSSEVIESEKIPDFEISDETGLSKQGEIIAELKESLQNLENNPSLGIAEQITQERSLELQNLNKKFESSKEQKGILNSKIEEAMTRFPGMSVDEFVSAYPKLENKVIELNSNIEESQKNIELFNEETEQMIDNARKEELEKLKENIKELESKYIGSEAEIYDNKVILDKELQNLLDNPKELFSEKNIADIYSIYGLDEGNKYIQTLFEASDKAKDESMKDSISKKMFRNTSDYVLGNYKMEDGDVSEALSNDIGDKLIQLQELNPDSKTINKALKLTGQARLVYLTESNDPQLKELAFWINKDSNLEDVLQSYPQYQEIFNKSVETKFDKQKNDEFYLRSQEEEKKSIDQIISRESRIYKEKETSNIADQIREAKDSEEYRNLDNLDQTMMSYKRALEQGQADTNLIKTLESVNDKYSFKDGEFNLQWDWAKRDSLISEIDKISSELSAKVGSGKFGEVSDFDNVMNKLSKDIDTESKKFILLRNNKEINRLKELQNTVNSEKQKYIELKEELNKEVQKWQEATSIREELSKKYKQLPKYIQQKLEGINDTSFDNITKIIKESSSEILNYEPDQELVSKRENIAKLNQKLEDSRK